MNEGEEKEKRGRKERKEMEKRGDPWLKKSHQNEKKRKKRGVDREKRE